MSFVAPVFPIIDVARALAVLERVEHALGEGNDVLLGQVGRIDVVRVGRVVQLLAHRLRRLGLCLRRGRWRTRSGGGGGGAAAQT